jgi:hypothetical protein
MHAPLCIVSYCHYAKKRAMNILEAFLIGLLAGLATTSFAQTGRDGFAEGLAAFERKDYEAARAEWIPLAKAGNANAQYYLGYMHRTGIGAELDHREAAVWFERAARQGHIDAQAHLGGMYEYGLGLPKDRGKAIQWYRRAALQGHPDAAYFLALYYKSGDGVPQDYRVALRWLREAVRHSSGLQYPNALHALGIAYELGLGVPQDYIEAHKWYNLAAAAAARKGIQGGFEMHSKDRDRLEQKMTPAQVAEAQRLARQWDAAASKPSNR